MEMSEGMKTYEAILSMRYAGVARINLTIVDDSLAISTSAGCARVTIFHCSLKLLVDTAIRRSTSLIVTISTTAEENLDSIEDATLSRNS